MIELVSVVARSTFSYISCIVICLVFTQIEYTLVIQLLYNNYYRQTSLKLSCFIGVVNLKRSLCLKISPPGRRWQKIGGWKLKDTFIL